MVLDKLDQLVNLAKENSWKTGVVVACEDEHTLEAVIEAQDFFTPVLTGKKELIEENLKRLNAKDKFEIIDCSTPQECARIATELVNQDKAQFIIKGTIQTSDLMKAIINKETGLLDGNLLSHMNLLQIPRYHKLLSVVDGGMVLNPTFEQKVEILKNTLAVFRKLGYKKPKVSALCAVEVVNENMPETKDAFELKEMALRGEFGECYLEGPISYDLAMSKEAAKIKKFDSAVAGDTDIIIAPNMLVANTISKTIYETAGGDMAGLIIGAKVPIVLTSRSSSAEEKFYSILFALSV